MKAELDTERREAPNWPPNCTWRSHLGPLACAQWCKSLHNDLLLGIVILGTLAASGRRQQLHHYNGTRTTPLWLSSNKPLNCQVLRKCGSESKLKSSKLHGNILTYSYSLSFVSSKMILIRKRRRKNYTEGQAWELREMIKDSLTLTSSCSYPHQWSKWPGAPSCSHQRTYCSSKQLCSSKERCKPLTSQKNSKIQVLPAIV